MGSIQEINYSSRTVPQSWTDAASDAPGAGLDFRSATRQRRSRLWHDSSIDMFTAFFASATMSLVSGYAWYLLHRSGFTTPWFAVGLGLLIAVALRLSVGSGDSQTRAVMALMFYIVTAVVVIFLLASASYDELYGSRPTWGQLEAEILHGSLVGPVSLLAWFLGGVVSTVAAKRL